MCKRLIAGIVLVFLTLALTVSPSFAAIEKTDVGLTGTRNADGSTSLYWNSNIKVKQGTTERTPGTVRLYARYVGKSWFDTNIRIDFSDGYYRYEATKNLPATEYEFKLIDLFGFESNITRVGTYTDLPPSNKDETDYEKPPSEGGASGPFDSTLFKNDPASVEEQAGYIEKFLAEVIMIIPRFIYNVIGIDEPLQIVFNRDIKNGMAPLDNLHLDTFTDGEYSAIGLIYERLRSFFPIPFVLATCLAGVLMLFSSTNTNSRLTAKDYLTGIFLCALLLQFGHYLWEFVFGLNSYLVEIFYSTIEGRIVGKGFIDTLCRWDTASFGMAAIAFVTVISVAILTWQYVLRKIMLAILLLIFPVVTLASMFPQTRGVLGLWFKELMANLFLQTGHAAAFALFILFTANGASFWLLLAFLLGMNSIASLVRRVIGAESAGNGVLGMSGTLLGIGSIMALGRMGSSLLGAKGTAPGANMLSMDQMTGTSGASTAMAQSTTGGAISMAARGAVIAGSALAGGALAGMATGNPGIGMMAGGMLGSHVGGKFSQLTDFLESVNRDVGNTGNSFMSSAAKRMGIFNAGQLYDPQSASQIGRNILGGSGVLGNVGAIGGYMASTATRTVSSILPGVGSSAAYQTGQSLSSFRERASQDILRAQNTLQDLTPKYNSAKMQLEKAKSPEFFPNEAERTLAIKEAQNNLDVINGQMAESRLTIMNGNWALSNEGIQAKLSQLREGHPPRNVHGGVDSNWR